MTTTPRRKDEPTRVRYPQGWAPEPGEDWTDAAPRPDFDLNYGQLVSRVYWDDHYKRNEVLGDLIYRMNPYFWPRDEEELQLFLDINDLYESKEAADEERRQRLAPVHEARRAFLHKKYGHDGDDGDNPTNVGAEHAAANLTVMDGGKQA